MSSMTSAIGEIGEAVAWGPWESEEVVANIGRDYIPLAQLAKRGGNAVSAAVTTTIASP